MRIYLIGYMGSGKTTLGKRVANRLGLAFIDMDDYIVNKEGRTINQMFEESGEPYFRKMEREALEDFSKMEDVLVATGGGAPCFNDNIGFMNTTGDTIYINASAGVLCSRLKLNRNERPLLKDKTDDELLEFIGNMLEKRKPFYSRATYIIDGFNPQVDDVLKVLKVKEKNV